MTGLHLPRPCLAESVTQVLRETRDHLRAPAPVYTDPAVIARWAQRLTPDRQGTCTRRER